MSFRSIGTWFTRNSITIFIEATGRDVDIIDEIHPEGSNQGESLREGSEILCIPQDEGDVGGQAGDVRLADPDVVPVVRVDHE